VSASTDAARVRRSSATAGQRLRARIVAGLADLLAVLPDGFVGGLADAVGEAWYRLAPRRASLGRRNLQRVTRHLVARGLASPSVAAAATDGAALERLLRATFRHAVRYYLDMARLPHDNPAEVEQRLRVETPDAVARAFGPDAPAILVAMHFGAVEYPARFAVARSRTSILAPMETLPDPALQAWVARTRSSTGIELVGLRDARRALAAALAAGRPVGIVADRNVAGGSLDTPFFGAPAPMPLGPALLAAETGRPIYLGAVRRLGGGRYAGRLYPVPVAAAGDRRERVSATMATLARTMEEAIAVAPEQWWSLLSPLWPDLDPRAATGTGRLEPPSEAPPPDPGQPEGAA
jgi:KDO2-lipid IV(A) lauroyltransferase